MPVSGPRLRLKCIYASDTTNIDPGCIDLLIYYATALTIQWKRTPSFKNEHETTAVEILYERYSPQSDAQRRKQMFVHCRFELTIFTA